MSLAIARSASGAVILVSLLAAPAWAEGTWDSYLIGWHVGKSSRSWTDNNSDGVSTSIRFWDCRYNWPGGDDADVRLTHERSLAPDESKGVRKLVCGISTGERDYWGDVEKGKYHFTIYEISDVGASWPTISAGDVDVWY